MNFGDLVFPLSGARVAELRVVLTVEGPPIFIITTAAEYCELHIENCKQSTMSPVGLAKAQQLHEHQTVKMRTV